MRFHASSMVTTCTKGTPIPTRHAHRERAAGRGEPNPTQGPGRDARPGPPRVTMTRTARYYLLWQRSHTPRLSARRSAADALGFTPA